MNISPLSMKCYIILVLLNIKPWILPLIYRVLTVQIEYDVSLSSLMTISNYITTPWCFFLDSGIKYSGHIQQRMGIAFQYKLGYLDQTPLNGNKRATKAPHTFSSKKKKKLHTPPSLQLRRFQASILVCCPHPKFPKTNQNNPSVALSLPL